MPKSHLQINPLSVVMSKITFNATFLLHLIANMAPINAFYLPSVSRFTFCSGLQISQKQSDQYCNGDSVMVFVNRLNTHRNILPYKYSHFDFCTAEDTYVRGSYGQVLLGDRIQFSPYILEFGHDTVCKKVCKKTYTPGNVQSMQNLTLLKFAIDLDYRHHWIVDNMPVTWCYRIKGGSSYCSPSFPVGCRLKSNNEGDNTCVLPAQVKEKDTSFLFNHIDITVEYHPRLDLPDGFKEAGSIVKVTAYPRSIQHKTEGREGCDLNAPPVRLPEKSLNSNLSFYYSYSVYWKRVTNVKWAERWNFLIDQRSHSNVSWFSLFNSTIISLFLFVIMVRIFKKHLSKASLDNKDIVIAERDTGWMLIDGDVFRSPQNAALLSAFVSCGIQLTVTALITLIFASLGFLSPANRGGLFTCFIITFLCCSPLSGYYSARMYKNLGGVRWILNTLLTVFLCPGLTFGTIFLLNCILYSHGSSAAFPVFYLVVKISLWFVISLPFTVVGALCGKRREVAKCPVSVNESRRPIPRRQFFCSAYLQPFWGGVLPFCCGFIQLYFILQTVWIHEIYYCHFVQLLLTFLLLVIIGGESSMILCFLQLKSQDYRWWWRSFLNGGWVAFYIYLYAIYFLFKRMNVTDGASIVLYCGYMAIFGFLVFLSSGCIGFLSCYWLVYKMYSRFQETK